MCKLKNKHCFDILNSENDQKIGSPEKSCKMPLLLFVENESFLQDLKFVGPWFNGTRRGM